MGYYHQDERDAATGYGCLVLGVGFLVGVAAILAALILLP